MESDFVETKVLEALIGAFSSTFSLREIASACCKAGRNPDMAAQILYEGAAKLHKNHSNAASVVSTAQCETSCRSSSQLNAKQVVDHHQLRVKVLLTSQILQIIETLRHLKGKRWLFQLVFFLVLLVRGMGCPTHLHGVPGAVYGLRYGKHCVRVLLTSQIGGPDKSSTASKPKKLALSVGSASSEVYAIRNTPAYGPLSTTEPLELDTKDLPIDELIDEDVSSDATEKEDQMRTEPGKFLWVVLFSDKSVADKVLLEKHVILGKKVEVGNIVLRSEHSDPYNQKVFNKSNGKNGQFRTKKIFVGGLSPNLTRKEFEAYFEKFGRTINVVIMYGLSTHTPRGFGFITFDSVEAVENVMQKRFHELNDKVVEVKRAVPKDGSNNGHNGGYNMRMNGGRGGSLFRGGEGAYRPNWGAEKGSKASKPKKLALSVGSASGKGYAMRNTPAYHPVNATKPLKLDIKDLPIDELIYEDVSSDSTAKSAFLLVPWLVYDKDLVSMLFISCLVNSHCYTRVPRFAIGI
ncbi:hypothetical protein MKW98_014233, partial [Papaver atlanticum]